VASLGDAENLTDPESRGSVFAGVATVLFSIPALVGS